MIIEVGRRAPSEPGGGLRIFDASTSWYRRRPSINGVLLTEDSFIPSVLKDIGTHLRIGCERLVDAATKPGVKRVPVRSGYADGFDYYPEMIADELY